MNTTKFIKQLVIFCSVSTIGIHGAKNEKPLYLSDYVNQENNARDVFFRLIAQGNTVVVFYADWCKPCKQLALTINSLTKTFPGITFIKVNIDTFSTISKQYDVKAVPTLIFFKKGKKVHRITGSRSKKQIIGLVKTVY